MAFTACHYSFLSLTISISFIQFYCHQKAASEESPWIPKTSLSSRDSSVQAWSSRLNYHHQSSLLITNKQRCYYRDYMLIGSAINLHWLFQFVINQFLYLPEACGFLFIWSMLLDFIPIPLPRLGRLMNTSWWSFSEIEGISDNSISWHGSALISTPQICLRYIAVYSATVQATNFSQKMKLRVFVLSSLP